MCRDSLSLFYPLKVRALKRSFVFSIFFFLFRGFIISCLILFLFALNVSVSSWGLAVLSFSCRFSGVKPVGMAKFSVQSCDRNSVIMSVNV